MKIYNVLEKILLSSLTLITLTSCSSLTRTEPSLEDLQKRVAAEKSIELENTSKILEGLAKRAIKRGDGNLDILVLSGGGQSGAYGAGFLKGWQRNSKNPMPKFDLVTGVSTGALQAPFAFIGSAESVEQVDDLYLNAGKKFGPSFDWTFWLSRTGGLINTTAFERVIHETFSPEFKTKLDNGFAEGRQLIISTASFDLGIGKTWNMDSEINGPGGVSRVESILLAASSIPGIFPSRIIDGLVQSDGGTVSNILPLINLEGYRQLRKRTAELGLKKPLKIQLWVIMNYWLYPRLESIDAASRSDMSKRGNSFLFVLAQPQALEHLYDLSVAATASIDGLDVKLHISAIPSALSGEAGAKEIFNKEWMARLEALGFERAQSSSPWDSVPSAFERSY